MKFANEIIIVGLISNNNVMADREKVQLLTKRCQDSNLTLSINKTKLLVVDYRKQEADHSPVQTGAVQRVRNLRFLASPLDGCKKGLRWTKQAENALKKFRQSLYFLRHLPAVQDIYHTGCRRKAQHIISLPSPPAQSLFSPQQKML